MNAPSLFMAGALVTGALIPLQVAFNAQLGGVTRSPLTATLIVFFVGLTLLLAVIAVARPSLPGTAALMAAPKTIWLGGLIAVIYVVSTVIVTPKLGVGLTTIFILTGQIVMALLLDHFGAFGNPEQSLNLWRLAGGALMVAGVVLIKTH